jgi:hypothetical protein
MGSLIQSGWHARTCAVEGGAEMGNMASPGTLVLP